ncbi:tetratricopeptide repeat protein [bacterium]|nr:tetratricopeptide repeat protein [bacterium]
MISGNLLFVILIFAAVIIIAGWYFYRLKIRYRIGNEDFIDGLVSIIENDTDSAVKYLHSAATNDTSNIIAFTLLGDILRQNGESDKAKKIHISLLSRAFIKSSQKARVYKSLALDAFAENNFQKALEYINRTISLNGDKWSYDFAAEILEKMGRWNDAFDVLSKGGGSNEILALYKVEIGKEFIDDNPHKARIIFKDALKLDPNCLPAIVSLGDAYSSEGKLKDALEWWEKITANFPKKAMIVLDKIESAYYELGEFDNAKLLYRKILKSSPELEFIRLRLAKIYEKMGKIDTALKIIQQAPERTVGAAIYEIKLLCQTDGLQSIEKVIDEQLTKFGESKFVCKNCGYESDVPLWHCPKCDEWNSFNFSI